MFILFVLVYFYRTYAGYHVVCREKIPPSSLITRVTCCGILQKREHNGCLCAGVSVSGKSRDFWQTPLEFQCVVTWARDIVFVYGISRDWLLERCCYAGVIAMAVLVPTAG